MDVEALGYVLFFGLGLLFWFGVPACVRASNRLDESGFLGRWYIPPIAITITRVVVVIGFVVAVGQLVWS